MNTNSVLTSDTTRHGPSQLSVLHSTRWSHILFQNRDFCLPHLHSTPPLGGLPAEYYHDIWYAKTRMVWIPEGEKKLWRYIYCFDRIHERDRQADRRTDGRTPHDSKGRPCIASRGNKKLISGWDRRTLQLEPCHRCIACQTLLSAERRVCKPHATCFLTEHASADAIVPMSRICVLTRYPVNLCVYLVPF